MPYVQFTDFISYTDEVRKLARNVVPADFTDDQIKPWQYRRYSEIRTETDKDNWTATDREFGALQLIETKLAASDIIEHYGDQNTVGVWQAMRESAYERLADIIENMEAAITNIAGSITRTDFKSWNLNSSVPTPNRLSSSITGGVESKGSREIDF